MKTLKQQIKDNTDENLYSIIYKHDELEQIYSVNLDDALETYKKMCTEMCEFSCTAFLQKKMSISLLCRDGSIWHKMEFKYKSHTYNRK